MGFPDAPDAAAPAESEGRLRAAPGDASGAHLLVMDAAQVRQGYSGGPVLLPGGEAAGLIKGVLRAPDGGAPPGVAIGPDAAAIAALLRREVPGWAPEPSPPPGTDNRALARKAVVHVLCKP
jgi:hypothetical protein